MNLIAIITARGGSKRIPKKNVKEFCGKPIIAYSIEAALQSELFDEVMVSTDSEEIKVIAESYGANVPFMRSEETSNDFAVTADVVEEVIHEYEKRGNVFDWICCIYPTAPFVTAAKLKAAFEMVMKESADSLTPVVSFSYPPQRGLIIRDGRLQYKYPEYELIRSQDLEVMYHDAGQFYFCKTDAFLQYHSLMTNETIPMILQEREVQDIDHYSDWELAEIKYKLMIKKEH